MDRLKEQSRTSSFQYQDLFEDYGYNVSKTIVLVYGVCLLIMALSILIICQFSHHCEGDEFALYKGFAVLLWLEWRAHAGKAVPTSVMEHVIISESDMQEYELYCKENLPKDKALMPCNELLLLWCTKIRKSRPMLHHANGLTYLALFPSQVDQLLTWISEMRQQHDEMGQQVFQ